MPVTIVSGNRVLLNSSQLEASPFTITIDNSSGLISHLEPIYRRHSPVDSVNDLNVKFIDAEDALVMPGVVDAHVHINEPGRTDWEGFEAATAAAAAGGCTTIMDMPLNAIPPTTTIDNFEEKLKAAAGKCFVNVGFYGGVIPGNSDQLKPLINKGVSGFKCFLIESGVDEFPHVTEKDLRLALKELKVCPPEMGTCHLNPASNSSSYSTFLESRPKILENDAIDLVIKLCREFKTRCHIVHLSSSDALPAIKKAKEEGLPLTVETCFHYLFFEAESIPSGATQYKCCPPIREAANREKLWEAILDGTIDYVVSDHSPCTANLKLFEKGDFMQAWGGIASVQFGIPAFWTVGKEKGVKVTDMIRLMCEKTAYQVNLGEKRGKIGVGYFGDLVIWSPEKSFTVEKDAILFKNKVSPYVGKTLFGVIEKTVVGGKVVYSREDGLSTFKEGKLLLV